MENFTPKNNNFEYDSERGVLFNKDLATENDKDAIKYQDFSSYGNIDNDAIGDTDPQQNVILDITERNLEKVDNEHSALNQEVVQNELESFATMARETLPMLKEHLKYQEQKLHELEMSMDAYKNRNTRLKNAKVGTVGNGHKYLGDRDANIQRTAEGFENLAAQYDALAETVDRLKGKIIYLNMMGNDVPEVDPSEN